MKRSWLLAAALVGLMASAALGFNNGAPTLECFNCHTEVGQYKTAIKVEGLPEAYKPGATYKVRIVLESTQASSGQVQGGFAVTASGGELLATDPDNTQVSDGILTHTQEGSYLRAWKFSWKAPKERQDVEVSMMATAANGDFSPVDDPIAAEIITIPSKK